MYESTKNASLERGIGQRIMGLRGKNGNETQEALAASVGVSREIIQHWERGTRHIKAEHIVALADHFGVSTDFLLGKSEAENPEFHYFAKYTKFSNDTIRALQKISGYGGDDLISRRSRIPFELLLCSGELDKIVVALCDYLDINAAVATEKRQTVDAGKWSELDKEICNETDGQFRVVQRTTLAQTLEMKAAASIMSAFEILGQTIGDKWRKQMPK